MRKILYVFGLLNDADIAWMARSGLRRRIAPGDVVILEDDAIDFVAIVLEGELLVSTRRAGGIARLGVGEIIGEMSLVESAPTSATIRASRPSLILAIDRTMLTEKLAADAGFAGRFYRALAVFLADRLRAAMAAGDPRDPADGTVPSGELDLTVLDTISAAGERFQRMLALLRAAPQ
ncbi:cyclic nucleotide-binding domain-containing protein [Methylobacterium sp. J-078]|uniref:cyclic nucleotide-binding domain-containing protein n=1 Tax=Methylobacterium sp. J-078 TaxID=2836657 RepID=UPI001FB9665B|nr:cyclic nucleotide-binding domain-containing protein [Methylobacterium sp. J-078]MCJ2045957.1 cyclic nucleotide-binding domain-containing protein [Methylobacterium sp. J-078]